MSPTCALASIPFTIPTLDLQIERLVTLVTERKTRLLASESVTDPVGDTLVTSPKVGDNLPGVQP